MNAKEIHIEDMADIGFMILVATFDDMNKYKDFERSRKIADMIILNIDSISWDWPRVMVL